MVEEEGEEKKMRRRLGGGVVEAAPLITCAYLCQFRPLTCSGDICIYP